MTDFNVQAGPQLGIYLNKIFERVLDDINERNTKQEIYTYLKSYIASQAALTEES